MGGPPAGGGVETMTGLRVSAPFTARWSAEAGAGVLLGSRASSVMDPALGASWLAARSARALVRLGAAATLPVGNAVSGGLGLAARSTRSVDPRLGVSAVVGATWLGVAQANARVPLYAGGDDLRQGAFLRGELDLARRLGGDWVVWGGASALGNLPDESGGGDFVEVAGVAGALWNINRQFALGPRLRVPVWGGEAGVAYPVAAGLTLRFVSKGEEEDGAHGHDG